MTHSEGDRPGSADRAQLELRHFRYFLAVASSLNFRQAAYEIGIAQPALSLQIQALERIVGARLFERTTRSVSLTAAGLLFKREAEQTLQQAERAQVVAERAGRGEIGHIRVAYAGSTLYSGLLPRTVNEFHRRFPQVSIQVEEIGIEEQLDLVERGVLDVGFIRLPISTSSLQLSISPVVSEPIALAVPCDHPLALRDNVDIADLANEDLISSQTDKVGILRQVMEAAGRNGFVPSVIRARHFGAILGLVSAGLGVATVPQSARVVGLSGVTYRALTGLELSPIAVVSRAAETAPPTLSFLQILREARWPAQFAERV